MSELSDATVCGSGRCPRVLTGITRRGIPTFQNAVSVRLSKLVVSSVHIRIGAKRCASILWPRLGCLSLVMNALKRSMIEGCGSPYFKTDDEDTSIDDRNVSVSRQS